MAKQLPRGIRNNNPGNIRWGSPWEGLLPPAQRTDTSFCQFSDPAYGIRALCRTLITYADKRHAEDGSAIDTVHDVISRWAPTVENDTEAYARAVARHLGVHEYQQIEIKQFDTMRGLIEAIIRHENGQQPYTAKQIEEGMRRAGIVRPVSHRGVPANTETLVGAGGSTAIGLSQVAPVLPDIADAISGQQENLTSGDWSRILVGGALILIGAAVAWSQYQRRQAGAA